MSKILLPYKRLDVIRFADWCNRSQPSGLRDCIDHVPELRRVAETGARHTRASMCTYNGADKNGFIENLFIRWCPRDCTEDKDPYFWAKYSAFRYGALTYLAGKFPV